MSGSDTFAIISFVILGLWSAWITFRPRGRKSYKQMAVKYQALCYWIEDGKIECCMVCPLEDDPVIAYENAQRGAYDLKYANPDRDIIGPLINVMPGW